MENFLQIDWSTDINDVYDQMFIKDERLENESGMYRIIHSLYKDPFEDLYKDYLDLISPEDVELLRTKSLKKQILINNKTKAATKVAQERKNVENSGHKEEKKILEKKSYVPGLAKCSIEFPRMSRLTASQQAACLNILIKCSGSEKPQFSPQDQVDLQTYLELKNTIEEEQNEFLNIAKQNWNVNDIKLVREDLINLRWKRKMESIDKMHRYYSEVGTIAINSQQKINYAFNETLLDVKNLPTVIVPTLKKRWVLDSSSIKVDALINRPSNANVSDDPTCTDLATSNNVDIVITNAGLNCLSSNLDTNYSAIWILPVTVKSINNNNVVFIDKPLPSTKKNIIEKNNWIYKYILKSSLVHSQDDEEKKNLFQYNLFTIGACGSTQNEMMKKKIEKDYKLLVRTKIDALEHMADDQLCQVKIAPKLEHQATLGAEAVSLEEAAKQWTSLIFSPDTSLLRFRINAKTSEVLQCERRSSISINNELKRLYNVNGEDIISFIYNIGENMSKMSPGKYLLRHTVRNGAFVSVYQAAPTSSKNTIDLEILYCDTEFQTLPVLPWPQLDKFVVTPMMKFRNRMPLMFNPINGNKNQINQIKKKAICKRQNKNKKKMKQNVSKKQ